jgi:aldehyde dehydrogenase (NAD+)
MTTPTGPELKGVTRAPLVRIPERRLLVGGEWVDPVAGETFATENPATGQEITTVARAGSADAARAVAAARRAFDSGSWTTMSAADRGRLMARLARLVDDNRDELVTLESLDGGKPVRATARQDLPAVIDCLEYYAGWADKIKGDVVPARADALTYLRRGPVGVVVAIVPWNFPLMNAVWKIAPALASGCVVLLKPAELTPLTALRLGELGLEAGLPPGVLNILPGYGDEVGAALVADPRVDKISFTGSPAVGKQIMRSAADNVTRVGLELGGKSPNIVFADADLEAAAAAATSGIFFNAGQVCSAGSRILVQDAAYEEFVALLTKAASGIRVGDPLDPATRMGPIISAKQLDRVTGYISIAHSEGAKLVAGGKRLDRAGYFVEPTIFGEVRGDMRIAQEEIFGPVASVIRFPDEDAAIAIANGTPYSLAAAVWSNDVKRVHRVAHRLRAGTVWVNTYGHTDTRLPWGGAGGDSGIGRDLGEAALANYTETKTIWISLQ